jgi:hypothetical protein
LGGFAGQDTDAPQRHLASLMLERGGDRGVVLLRFLDDDELELAENALPAEDTDPALASEEDRNELTLGDRHQRGTVSGRAEKASFDGPHVLVASAAGDVLPLLQRELRIARESLVGLVDDGWVIPGRLQASPSAGAGQDEPFRVDRPRGVGQWDTPLLELGFPDLDELRVESLGERRVRLEGKVRRQAHDLGTFVVV